MDNTHTTKTKIYTATQNKTTTNKPQTSQNKIQTNHKQKSQTNNNNKHKSNMWALVAVPRGQHNNNKH